MSDHRRTVSSRSVALPGWALAVVAVLCLGGAGWLGWIALDEWSGDTAPVAAPSPSAEPTPSATTPSPEPTPSATTPSPEPTASPEPSPSDEPAADRTSFAVSVLNASSTAGLAARVGQQTAALGWSVPVVGNWRGAVAQNTVHYPAGGQDAAELLADDLGIGATAPAVAGMSTERLTVVLVTAP